MPTYFTGTSRSRGAPDGCRVDSGSVWEPIAGYSRAVRIGGPDPGQRHHGDAWDPARSSAPADPAGQATFILDKIAASLSALGGTMADVVRTRVYLADADDWEPVSRAHGRAFGDIRPANTLLEVGRLVGDYRVEIEAEAVVDP